MKLEEFDKFVEIVLSTMKESYADHTTCEYFLDTARSQIFEAEIKDHEEYKKYLELKAKFEP